MTEKRFTSKKDDIGQWTVSDKLNQYTIPLMSLEQCSSVANAMNCLWEQTQRFEKHNQRLENKNEQLKQELEEVKTDEKQLGIEFMGFKMKLIEKLQKHYDYASEQRQNNLDEPVLAKAYDIIRYDVRNLAEELRVDLK